ncbi:MULTISPECIES: hypothetical protein [Pseudomonas]|uniref:Uncharacterized protein n=1 Tax=Pseudomonas lutea TaxID=243924 RepID=A0A9X8MH92_9PSED|nr:MULTISPECIES: hypothetical protein [Pseudomonas]SER39442.1 hypothetical protein SAMN05216409_11917 [Pseudomonas lutea]
MTRTEPSWVFNLANGQALPKHREVNPSQFDIPHGHQSLFPVRVSDKVLYLSFIDQPTPTYFLCPDRGPAQQLDTQKTERQLLAGLLCNLSGRINAITIFGRIMKFPEYLHEPAIDYLAGHKELLARIYQGNLHEALKSLNQSLGAITQRAMIVAKIASELVKAAPADRQKIISNYRRDYPEAWLEQARSRATAIEEEQHQSASEADPEFKFEF